MQIVLLNVTELPFSYQLLFKISSTIAALVPLIIFVFLYFTIEIMLNDFFGENIDKKKLIKIIGLSYLPMLIYQYYFWFNILFYCNTDKIKSASEFLSMTFMFDLQLSDFEFINTVCWGFIYLYIIIYLIYHDVNILAVLVSVLFPSVIAALSCYIITY
ncbi:hypothetical protein HMPREF9135_1156 [Segatella baroniae F0067]|uniref:Yip1 domain protein n=1 Tax=Segatella baroniae F0067 TaxID=1115809 RepID=U2P5X2_9BACT|nr:hypothetical protein HMPREF9135_1156 [Segatella baroniae F0067]